jgi:hypothetical protein
VSRDPRRTAAGLRSAGRLLTVGLTMIAVRPAAGAEIEADSLRPEQALLAIFALETQIQTENTLVDRVEDQYKANLEERTRYRTRLERLAADLDTAWAAPEEATDAEALARADDELERLEKAMVLAWDEGRRLRREILTGRARLAILRGRLAELSATLPATAESLTGYWDVRLLSGGERGVFFLVQSGAVLSGEYGLEGGYKGSLQGTYVDGQVMLQRIDTRLGRIMDLDGTVAADGKSIRGTWRRHDLSSGRPATGAWSATRREPSASEEPAP